MIKKKRILLTCMIVLVIIFCLAGCGDDSQNSMGNLQSNVNNTPAESTVPGSEAYSQGNNHGENKNENSHHEHNGGDIGAERAVEIAVAKVPGATAADVTEIERDHDHGRVEYDGQIIYNGYEYDFEIDGATGNVLKWEIDN